MSAPLTHDAAPNPRLVKGAKRLGLGYAAVAIMAFLPWDALDEPGTWLFVPFGLIWQLGPVLVAALLVKASRGRSGQRIFLGLEAVQVLVAVLMVVPVLLYDPNALLLMAMVVPFYQVSLLAVVWLLAMLMGWRARDGWR